MALVVEDGTVVEDANAYADVAYADAYLAANIHVFAQWDALAQEQKEFLLVWATRELDAQATWRGSKTDEESPLRWPRTGVYDVDGVPIGVNEIPTALKNAVCELARFLMVRDRTQESGREGIKVIQADVVRLEFDEYYRAPVIPPLIGALIRGLGIVAGGTGFKPIKRT